VFSDCAHLLLPFLPVVGIPSHRSSRVNTPCRNTVHTDALAPRKQTRNTPTSTPTQTPFHLHNTHLHLLELCEFPPCLSSFFPTALFWPRSRPLPAPPTTPLSSAFRSMGCSFSVVQNARQSLQDSTGTFASQHAAVRVRFNTNARVHTSINASIAEIPHMHACQLTTSPRLVGKRCLLCL
jgi:hypothetical protein